MKSKDVQIGRLYMTKNRGVVLVIDKGKFTGFNSGEGPRKVKYKTMTIDIGQSWYFANSNEKQARIVVVSLTSHSVQVITGGSLIREWTDDEVREQIVRMRVEQESRERQSKLEEHKAAFTTTLKTCLSEVSGVQPRRYYGYNDGPYAMLLDNPEFVQQLLTLWLRYHELKGLPVGASSADPADLLHEFQDSLQGLNWVATKSKDLRSTVEADVRAQIEQCADDSLQIVEV